MRLFRARLNPHRSASSFLICPEKEKRPPSRKTQKPRKQPIIAGFQRKTFLTMHQERISLLVGMIGFVGNVSRLFDLRCFSLKSQGLSAIFGSSTVFAFVSFNDCLGFPACFFTPKGGPFYPLGSQEKTPLPFVGGACLAIG